MVSLSLFSTLFQNTSHQTMAPRPPLTIHTLCILLSLQLTTSRESDDAMLVRFRNVASYDIVLWWLTPHEGEEIRFFGHLTANGGMTSFTSYANHRFFWAEPNKEQDPSQRKGFFRIQRDKILYLFEDPANPGDAHLVRSSQDEQRWLQNY